MTSKNRKSTETISELLQQSKSGCAEPAPHISEQLRRCPEAFKVGEILGKAFDSPKYRQDDVIDGDRLLPPPATIIPPFA